MLKHKVDVENKLADALSCRVALLNSKSVEVTGLERVKEDYSECLDFGVVYASLLGSLSGS